jgi:predicted peptidase
VSGGVVTPSVQPLASLKSLMPPEMFALYSAPDPHAAFARAVGKTPVWIFHGGQDDTVAVNESRRMAAALKAASGTGKYTEYPEEKHFIADRVFTDAEFWEWLMGQRLSQ